MNTEFVAAVQLGFDRIGPVRRDDKRVGNYCVFEKTHICVLSLQQPYDTRFANKNWQNNNVTNVYLVCLIAKPLNDRKHGRKAADPGSGRCMILSVHSYYFLFSGT